jgi:hypothetical protein
MSECRAPPQPPMAFCPRRHGSRCAATAWPARRAAPDTSWRPAQSRAFPWPTLIPRCAPTNLGSPFEGEYSTGHPMFHVEPQCAPTNACTRCYPLIRWSRPTADAHARCGCFMRMFDAMNPAIGSSGASSPNLWLVLPPDSKRRWPLAVEPLAGQTTNPTSAPSRLTPVQWRRDCEPA